MYLYILANKTEYSKMVEAEAEMKQKRFRMVLLGFYCLFFVILLSFGLRNQINNPRDILYLTSVINKNVPLPLFAVILSHVYSIFALVVIFITAYFFETLILGFAIFVQSALAVLENSQNKDTNDKPSKFIDKDRATLCEESLNRFNDLKDLVNHFNGFFGLTLILFKGFALLNLYFFIYCLLTDKSNPGLILYFLVASIQLIRALSALPPLASVYTQSIHFKDSWTKSLKSLTDLQIHQVALIQPFGIKPGNMYVVIPSTSLTFLSIMTTHIIVLLQVFGVK